MKRLILQWLTLVLVGCASARAQIDSGSNGSDGAFQPTTNTVVDMADHPDGIYHYTSVYIPSNVTVSFIPNANNTPVVWLVQSNVVINGTVDVRGQNGTQVGGPGGPGGFAGGNGGAFPSVGRGPGGGERNRPGGFATGTLTYGNKFLVPLIGGSGGGGTEQGGGGGGGGALLIVAQGSIAIEGWINAQGGDSFRQCGWDCYHFGGGGSGGGIRLVGARVTGRGRLYAPGGVGPRYKDNLGNWNDFSGGVGWIRIDAFEHAFVGGIDGVFSSGFQPITFPVAGQNPSVRIASVGGVPVSATPGGALAVPDAVLSAQQQNPVPIVVQCSRIPLNTLITVTVRPAHEPAVSATAYNSVGTFESSTATVLVNIPRGGGWIYATAPVGN